MRYHLAFLTRLHPLLKQVDQELVALWIMPLEEAGEGTELLFGDPALAVAMEELENAIQITWVHPARQREA